MLDELNTSMYNRFSTKGCDRVCSKGCYTGYCKGSVTGTKRDTVNVVCMMYGMGMGMGMGMVSYDLVWSVMLWYGMYTPSICIYIYV